MNTLYYYFIALGLAILLILLGNFVTKNKIKNTKNWLYKAFSLVLATVYVVRFLSGDNPLEFVQDLTVNALTSPSLTAVSMLLTWFTYTALLLTALYPFFKIKNLQNVMKFFVLPVAVLDLVFLQPYLTNIVGDITTQVTYRAILLCIEIGILLAYSFSVLANTKWFKISKTGIKNLLLSIVPMMLATMPNYALNVLFGALNPRIQVIDFSIYHRLFLYAGFAIPFFIWLALHNKNEEVRRFSLMFLGFGTLLSFLVNYKFDVVTSPNSWPIHLCHTAMFIVPITLVFKTEKVFYFTFFINVLGALLAMLMPNYGARNITEPSLNLFWINHFIAFFLPLLVVALRIYPRPKLKHFIYSTIGFSVYFLFVLIVNAWFSNYGSVDFFFVNSDFIAEKLGTWAENLRDFTWTFNINNLTFVFYPIYQVLFFLVYVVAAFGVWFVYEQVYSFTDQLGDMAKRRKQLHMDKHLLMLALNGRGVEEPMNKENENKLVLKNFSKKYGNSDVFAVKNANLEVCGGEIFGFLGPNGAGKSTIIKSIVGIQPITSGSIEVCGYDVDKQAVQTKRLIGFVPDHYALYEKLTGREYINYIADLYGVSKADRDERISKYLNAFALEQAFDNQMKTYSHGMKQKIAIMSALVHNPKLWILDEPLTGLDPTSIFQVKEAMKEHAQAGNIVFFSSHIIDVVERICDRIAIIKKGQIQTSITLQELDDQNINLEDYYLQTIGETKKETDKKRKGEHKA